MLIAVPSYLKILASWMSSTPVSLLLLSFWQPQNCKYFSVSVVVIQERETLSIF